METYFLLRNRITVTLARLVRDHMLSEEVMEDGGSIPKRPRLESVIVQREQAAGRGGTMQCNAIECFS
jgi:hypothetical protein